MAAGDRLRVRPPARHWPWLRPRSLRMPTLRGRGALGLRGRIIGAVLVTTVATLAVAALALLGPLEQSLRNAEKQTLRHDLQRSTISQFRKLHLNQFPASEAARDSYQADLYQAQQLLAVRIGGIVNVLGYPEPNGRGKPLLPDRLEGTTVNADKFDDVAKVFSTHRAV
jgi:hypothetical protein